MALSAQQDIDIYRFFAIAFGAAPGKTYYQQVADAYNAGLTTKQIVNIFTTKSVFLDRYPGSLGSAEFARRLVDNVVGSSASDADKNAAVQDIVNAMNGGMTRGDVIYTVFNNLANKSFQDPTWGKTALKMANEVAVARFVTGTLGEVTTDVATLQAFLNGITSDTVLAERYTQLASAFRNNQASAFTVYGNTNDNIQGTVADDRIDGGMGHDTITGGDGNDVLYGNSGDDKIYGGAGADFIDGGLGADYIDGGRISVWQGKYYVYDTSVNIIFGGGGADTIDGGYGNDQLYGDDGADVIYGYEGADLIFGGSGADRIYGGGGKNTIDGGDGDDSIDSGDDCYVDGGAGNDDIHVGFGSSVYGGLGNDDIEIGYYNSTSSQPSVVRPGDGHDQVTVYDAHRATGGVVIDLSEDTPGYDQIIVHTAQSVTPTVTIKGFKMGDDEMEIGEFYTVDGYRKWSAGYYNSFTKQWQSYTQIITSPTQAYQASAGFFVIQGAAAAAADTVSVAAFLDPYGNNHTYKKYTFAHYSYGHYFLINVGANDMGLYYFKDDSGADNRVVPDEITPIAIFAGLRTDQLSLIDVLGSFT
ncbi:calcium-binding protein [Tepidimonas charontis]|uniref:RTX-I toxin determinant A from serotypes 1/9 n=1 Tax=Tepidimonas charontis TaxID=2267262 RepID=A0A554XCB1_9BURK|nr:calcium-binding protein [Tepidimonas charontis]TSE33468.1 RTX-I toxin determinant A from serotypes 1/9 [Tepidimonas charontis]